MENYGLWNEGQILLGGGGGSCAVRPVAYWVCKTVYREVQVTLE